MSHVLLTGPITGEVVTQDGTVVDVNAREVPVDHLTEEQVAEVAHLVGLRYAAEGHPALPAGEAFQYDTPEEFTDYTVNPDNPTSITEA